MKMKGRRKNENEVTSVRERPVLSTCRSRQEGRPVQATGAENDVFQATSTRREEPTLISRVTLSWVFPFLKRGSGAGAPQLHGEALKAAIPPFPRYQPEAVLRGSSKKRNSCISSSSIAEEIYAKIQLANEKKWSVWSEIWLRGGKKHFVVTMVLSLLQGPVTYLARPLILKKVIEAASSTASSVDATYTSSSEELVILVTIFAFVLIFESFLIAHIRQRVCADFVGDFLAWLVPLVHLKVMKRHQNALVFDPRPPPAAAAEKDGDELEKQEIGERAAPAAAPGRAAGSPPPNEVTLIGNDVLRLCDDLKIGISSLIANLVGIVAGTVGIFLFVGFLPGVVGISFMLSTVAFSTFVSRNYMAPIVRTEAQIADSRLATMREMVEGIQQVKFLAWEQNYLQLLFAKRADELSCILRHRKFQIACISLGRNAPGMAACATFVFMVAVLGEELHAADVFATVTTFLSLRLPLITTPICLNALFTWRVLVDRLEAFLLRQGPDQEEFGGLANGGVGAGTPILSGKKEVEYEEATIRSTGRAVVLRGGKCEDEGREMLRPQHVEDHDIVLQVTDGCFGWEPRGPSPSDFHQRNAFLLQNLNLQIKRGSVVAVVGSVGSGKTSLLLSLLGSMVRYSGQVKYNGGRNRKCRTSSEGPHSTRMFGYVPQKPFVISGTIRENVVMGRDHDVVLPEDVDAERLLDLAIRRSQLEHDLLRSRWSYETEIGERGTTLSGGQQQRLSIARAVFGGAEVLVIDDALSAVDGQVANRIWEEVVCGAKREGRTVVIALNQLHFLERRWGRGGGSSVGGGGGGAEAVVDKILYLEKGRVRAEGPDVKNMGRGEGAEAFAQFYAAEKNEEVGGRGVGAEEVDEKQQESPPLLTQRKQSRSQTDVDRTDLRIVSTNPPSTSPSINPVFAKEQAQVGQISRVNTLKPFFLSCGGYNYLSKMLAIAVGCYSAMALTDLWLADWVSTSSSTTNSPSPPSQTRPPYPEHTRILVYVALTLLHLFGLFSLSYFNAVHFNAACGKIHNRAAETVMHATFTWFEQTPSGRILSRFGADLSAVEHLLLMFWDDLSHFTTAVVAFILIIAVIVPIVLPVILFSMTLFVFTVKRVALLSMEAKRLVNQSFAPVLTLLAESGGGGGGGSSTSNDGAVLSASCGSGSHVIHAMGLQPYLQQKLAIELGQFLRCRYFAESVTHAGFLYASWCAYAISIAACCVILAFRQEPRDPDDEEKLFSFSPGEVGVALSYSFVLPYFFSLLVLISCFFLNMMVSLERVLEFGNTSASTAERGKQEHGSDYIMQRDREALFVPQEPDWYKNRSCNEEVASQSRQVAELVGGTTTPHIEFRNVSLRYRQNLPLALRNISLKLQRGSKTGVIGRTGAGKSSLLVALFRLVEIEIEEEVVEEQAGGGDSSPRSSPRPTTSTSFIRIDGVDTRSMGLQQLRRQITVIPQQVLLLNGSLKQNLDPFNEHTDEELVQILEEVGLFSTAPQVGTRPSVSKELLNARVSSKEHHELHNPGGRAPAAGWTRTSGEQPDPAANQTTAPSTSNPIGLSAGEQQLLAIARALLKKRPIVVMDEPSANIDNNTDRRLQALLRQKFSTSHKYDHEPVTMITIAHRLQTIIDFDRIIVMEAGRIVEDGPPWELVERDREGGALNEMLSSYGAEAAEGLRARARRAKEARG